MAQPAEVTGPVEELLEAWTRAQKRLEAEQATVMRRIATTTSTERKAALRRRLARIEGELLAVVADEMAILRAATSDYLGTGLPAAWKKGAQVASPTSFVWAAPHRTGLTAMVNDTWSDVLAATDYVAADTKRWLGDAGSKWSELRFTTGMSPQEARREFLRDADVRGIKAVRYSDGSQRTIDDYGDMLLRTKQAVAFSTGTIVESKELGFTHLLVFDGEDCGWSGHDAVPLADGLIVPVDMAAATPTSHPRCRRAFGPVTVPEGTAADAVIAP